MSDPLWQFVKTRKLVVHLGAHKTATTYLQNALNTKREDLRRAGTALILPRDLRRGEKAARADGAEKMPGVTVQLSALAADTTTQRIVLSEENFIGSTGHNLAQKSLYPGIRRRLSKLPAALNHPNVTILFSLRDYGPFVSSNVTTALRFGRMFDTEDLQLAFLLMDRSWIDVIADLRSAFPAAQLKLWRYENFAQVEQQVFKEMVGPFRAAPQRRANQTLSGRAVAKVQARLQAGGPDLKPRQIVRRIKRKFPISDANPTYSIWTPEEAALLTESYQAHWDEICDAYPALPLDGG
ncbi:MULTISPECIES: hypothetical protein [unclassified Roseovarius]|uniref:hypothetical protein n=1 Tax=unclassified Roseovarius TaxID=2614913 RepID=UPI00273F8859|nr:MULTISPECIES: hypothetical protein [unclassified Roseovarius]